MGERETKTANDGAGTPLEMTLEELREYFDRLAEGVVVSVSIEEREGEGEGADGE